MKKYIVAAIGAGLAIVCAVALFLADTREDAFAGETAKGATAQKAPTKATLPPGANAAEVYGKLTKEVEAISKQLMNSTSPEEQLGYYNQIEAKFVAFRSRWPDTTSSGRPASSSWRRRPCSRRARR